jgi:hypothetical protein
MRKALTIEELTTLPAVVDLMTAARAFNLGRTLAYDLARRGEFPVPTHRYGRSYRVHTTDILKALTAPGPPSTTRSP